MAATNMKVVKRKGWFAMNGGRERKEGEGKG